MPRRSPGEGSIVQRADGRWCAALQVGGKRKYLYGKTRSEVAEKLRTLVAQTRTVGRLPDAGRRTLGEYLTTWLDQARGHLRPGTLASYQTLIRCHVLPALGHLPLSRLQPLHLAAHTATLTKTLSPRRRQMVHRVLHKALGDAVRWGLIPTNAAALVPAPKVEAPTPTLWTPEQVRTFLTAVLAGQGGRYGPLFAFLLASGARVGEALGLRWSDLHWEQASVRIERQVTWVQNQPVELPPKTKHGHRSIVLPSWGIEALRRQRVAHAEWRLRRGAEWRGGERIFTTETGISPSPTNLRRAFRAVCERLGLPVLRLHDLRHVSLSLLAMHGVPVKVAQARAGHSTPTLTLQVYTHVLGDADRQAVEALNRALPGGEVARG